MTFIFSGHIERESAKAWLISPRLNVPGGAAWFPKKLTRTIGYDSTGRFQTFAIPRWLAKAKGFADDVVESGGERHTSRRPTVITRMKSADPGIRSADLKVLFRSKAVRTIRSGPLRNTKPWKGGSRVRLF
jgi:hypothetical protein